MSHEIHRGGSTDPLVVSTEALAQQLERWIGRFNREHPQHGFASRYYAAGTNRGLGPQPEDQTVEVMPPGFGAINYLALYSGKSPRGIQRVLRRETKFTSLDLADRLLSAIDRNDLLQELEIVPNPMWTLERWLAWKESCDEQLHGGTT